jgi:hypothetical protein
MTSADQYRVRAAQFVAMARVESDPHQQREYATMAQSYFRLAMLAEQNSKNDVVYETPKRA